jgi:hypothetical protein
MKEKVVVLRELQRAIIYTRKLSKQAMECHVSRAFTVYSVNKGARLTNTLELGSQSKLIREKIQRHIDSSPTLMVHALEKFAKGAEMMAHQMVLMCNQVAELQAANEAAT